MASLSSLQVGLDAGNGQQMAVNLVGRVFYVINALIFIRLAFTLEWTRIKPSSSVTGGCFAIRQRLTSQPSA